jgi:hypothetical protein
MGLPGPLDLKNDVVSYGGRATTDSIDVPPDATSLEVVVDRTDWPAKGATIGIEVSDDGLKWDVFRVETIAAAPVNPKTGAVDPASISIGWNGQNRPAPKKVRAFCASAGGGFSARTIITAR